MCGELRKRRIDVLPARSVVERTRSVVLEVKGKRKQGRPKKMWKTQVEKESKSVGLKKDDALNQARWKVGVGEIAVRVW